MEETLFLNPELEVSQLPQAEESTRNPLNRTYLKVQFLGMAIFMAFLLLPLIPITLSDAPNEIIPFYLGVWAFFLIFRLIVIPLGFKKKSYSLREKDITYRTGLLWYNVTTIPFQRMQHCEVNRGPLEQLFGLASLKVYTAGGGSTDLVVPGLSPEDADQMKDYILKQISGNDRA